MDNAAASAIRLFSPAVHDDHEVWLYERLDRVLPRHDPLGRDRLISCGAALEHVLLAMRVTTRTRTRWHG